MNFSSIEKIKKTILFLSDDCLFIKKGGLSKLVDNPPIVLIAPFVIVLQSLYFIEI
jgi:hypothetical protein